MRGYSFVHGSVVKKEHGESSIVTHDSPIKGEDQFVVAVWEILNVVNSEVISWLDRSIATEPHSFEVVEWGVPPSVLTEILNAVIMAA